MNRYINRTNSITYTLLCGMLVAPATNVTAAFTMPRSLSKDQLKYVCYFTSGIATVATTCAVTEYFNKRKLRARLERDIQAYKAQTQKVNKELELIKSEEYKLEQEREFLSSLSQLLKSVTAKYKDEIGCAQGPYDKNSLESTVNLVHKIQAKIQLQGCLTTAYIQELKQDLNQISKASENLAVKALEWSQTASKAVYRDTITTLSDALKDLGYRLQSTAFTAEYFKSIVELNIALAQNYENKYATELKLQAQASNAEHYAADLDAHIRALYSDAQYQFAYLSYVAKVQSDISTLKSFVHNVPTKPAQLDPFTATMQRAQGLIASLETLVEYVVTTATYIQEKQHKPEFDRQEARAKQELHEKQERLALQLREAQARIDQEKRVTETKLQQERARVKTLENQYAEIERERKALDVKDRQIALERARIRDGVTIQEALSNNNNDWNYKYSSLHQHYTAAVNAQNGLTAQLNAIQAEKAAELARINNELNQARTQIKNHETNYHNLNRDYKALQNKAHQAANTLAVLDITNPPFNPDMVDGLRNYINTIKTHARTARNTLA
ncbi:hypothetical protein H0X48_00680 [Candidatus Dependentiae bacterium]|nr:hypothetical protein [Candidatus Dependentiae bacterium]